MPCHRSIDLLFFPLLLFLLLLSLSPSLPLSRIGPSQWVLDAAHAEIARLEALAETIIEKEGAESETVLDIYESLDALDPSTFESRASKILIGLG